MRAAALLTRLATVPSAPKKRPKQTKNSFRASIPRDGPGSAAGWSSNPLPSNGASIYRRCMACGKNPFRVAPAPLHAAGLRALSSSAAKGGGDEEGGERKWTPFGIRVTKVIEDAQKVAKIIDEWVDMCAIEAVEDENLGKSGESRKEQVERVFRAVLSQERVQVLGEMRDWLPYMLSEYPLASVVGSFDKETDDILALACIERCQGDTEEEEVLKVRNIAVKPDGDGGGWQGGWSPSEDYCALQMAEGVKAKAKDSGLRADFSELAEVHEGRIYLKTDPFSTFGNMPM